MNITYKHTISYFMLLCFLAALVPTNVFHHHDHLKESFQCNKKDLKLEKDPCHLSIYHAKSNELQCEHDSHITNTHDTCEFCKVVTPRRFHYDLVKDYQFDFIPVLFHPDFLIGYESFKIYNISSSILGRAPPVC